MEGNLAFVFVASGLPLLIFVVVKMIRSRPFSDELFVPPAVERSPDPDVYTRLPTKFHVGATYKVGGGWSWPLCALRVEPHRLVIRMGPVGKEQSIPFDDIATVSRHGILQRGTFRLFLRDRSVVRIYTWFPWSLNRILQGLGFEVRKSKRGFSGFDAYIHYP